MVSDWEKSSLKLRMDLILHFSRHSQKWETLASLTAKLGTEAELIRKEVHILVELALLEYRSKDGRESYCYKQPYIASKAIVEGC
ncbi:MAG: hypothetical protein ACOY4Q_14545 [Bacillota bacterium]